MSNGAKYLLVILFINLMFTVMSSLILYSKSNKLVDKSLDYGYLEYKYNKLKEKQLKSLFGCIDISNNYYDDIKEEQ